MKKVLLTTLVTTLAVISLIGCGNTNPGISETNNNKESIGHSYGYSISFSDTEAGEDTFNSVSEGISCSWDYDQN